MSQNDPFINMASIYDLLPGAEYEEYVEKIFQSIKERYPNLNNATLVDIGGGTGLVTYQIFNRVGKIILIEPSEEMLNVAKRKYFPNKHKNIEFKQGGFPVCGLDRNSVEIFIAVYDPFMYLLSLDEQISALNDIFQCLRSGGLIFIDIFNFFSLILRYEKPKLIEFDVNNKKIAYINQHNCSPLKEQWIHTYKMFIEDKLTGEIKKIVSKHIIKMISPTEMRLLLMRTNFIDIEIISPPNAEENEKSRIWCFARKP
jgi:ubiquinone/menaquinone biosynthesis C-methylase UbiE